MTRVRTRLARRALASCALLAILAACDRHPLGTEGGQWRSYAGDPGGSRYSALDQIDASNFADLELAWVWEALDANWKRQVLAGRRRGANNLQISDRLDITNFQATPLMVDGVLYGSSPMGTVFAVDGATGEERWMVDPRSYRSARRMWHYLRPKTRGVTYWRDGEDERIFLPTHDAFLMALDAKTGRAIQSFGDKGRVDLMANLRGEGAERLGNYFQSSPAALVGDVLVVGSSVGDNPKRKNSIPGDIQGFDVRTGERLWVFHTVPAEGEPGTDTWENESWRYNGAANAWGPMTVDPELGAVYIGTSSPSNDYYGGHRLGDNLFADSLLVLDGKTGRRLWHFQLIHHDLWDYDPISPPNLLRIRVDGKRIDAVAHVTKHGYVFTFDRKTGEPVWPIEEVPVPPSEIPGERASPTQPIPTRPPPFERIGISEHDANDLTPEIKELALELFGQNRLGPLFTPPSLEGTLMLPGNQGGANWQGAAVDPETGMLYVPSITNPTRMVLMAPDPKENDHRYTIQTAHPVFLQGYFDQPVLMSTRPPYSRITAYDMNRGEIAWQVAHGDALRSHPGLAGLDLPRLGSGARGCVIVTATLVIATEGTSLSSPKIGEPILWAYDKATGEVVGQVELPARPRGCPMTYRVDGRQFIAVAVAESEYPPSVVALALPE